MSTTKDYYAILYDFISKNQTLWQVTIISSEGSTPAKPGMKMLIPLTGKVFGNLGEVNWNTCSYQGCGKNNLLHQFLKLIYSMMMEKNLNEQKVFSYQWSVVVKFPLY